MLHVGHTVEDELKDKYCVMRSAHPINLHCMPCVHPLIKPACDAVEAACNDKALYSGQGQLASILKV